jgi:hypothetical protein
MFANRNFEYLIKGWTLNMVQMNAKLVSYNICVVDTIPNRMVALILIIYWLHQGRCLIPLFEPRHQIVYWGNKSGVPNTIFLGQNTPSTRTTMAMQMGMMLWQIESYILGQLFDQKYWRGFMGVGKYVGDVGHYNISYDTSSHSIWKIMFIETTLPYN